ncbi:polysaccharide deacetylase family protein [Pseudonocardia sp. DSM 110487]|uniref:polysaccharide deacetylase family protein n=1 Tax=Pseudonocardia sp. DSM 110487 TaxID=2865833 RepID=UPI001C6A3605|nr:polysaccharide deacetylase family protein [Pseudonocardia sp. DSM 110487]QYN34472.1 polysaccharide deacetylase family protein [Pseudonocardia sp. DSM 110487]
MRSRADRLLVLGYHNIESTWFWPSRPGAGIATFARQMRVLHRIANVVPLEDALDALAAGRPLPPRAVALTFDDGYRDNLELAAPVLRGYGMPATIYLVPGFLSGEQHAWWERLGWAVGRARARRVRLDGQELVLGDDGAALRTVETLVKRMTHDERMNAVERLVEDLRPSGEYRADELFLDWDAARGLVPAGMTVGSHTLSHAILGRETAADQHVDLRESRRVLQRELSAEVATLAYPNGTRDDYDDATFAAAREAGYSHAVTAWGGPVSADAPPFEITRTMVSTSTSAPRFAAKILKQMV